ncbi:MAG TPA: ABC transporter ATP-binding protein [Steroidobacteraceae bacterium]
MLEIDNVRKRFGDRVAVDGVSFKINNGETVGLLGPNGAGKTTTLSMICGLLRADSGSLRVDGESIGPDAVVGKYRVGLVPQDLALIEELSAEANLELFGGLYGLSGRLLDERSTDALELVGLTDRRTHAVGTFSGGMKRRLNIAGALLHDPALVLLDEPTVGVDPQSRAAIFANLEELKRRGKTLLYTTHYMEEAERLCDRIVIMDHGKVLADDTISGLRRRLPASKTTDLTLRAPLDATNLARLREVPGISAVVMLGDRVRLQAESLEASLPQALALIATAGIVVEAVQSHAPRLEDVFIALTGHALRDAEAA